MLSLLGTNQTLVQVVAQVERVKLAGDGVSYVGSSKTITDHALSKVMNKDCKIFHVVTREPVCADKTAVVAADADAKVNAAPAPADEATAQTETQAAPESTAAISAPPVYLSRSVISD
jgi:hypothetical protein